MKQRKKDTTIRNQNEASVSSGDNFKGRGKYLKEQLFRIFQN